MNALLLIVTVVLGCGGSDAPPPEDATHQRTSSRGQPEADDGVVVEGTLGSISPMAVESTMQQNLERLFGCYREALPRSPWLAGEVVLAFRIGRDGTVRWVVPQSESLGDHATLACLVERAGAIRFPRPVGGEAEASYPIAFRPGGGGRPPDPWTADRVTEALAEHRADIDGCGASGGGYRLTMVLDRGGRVAAAGVSYSDPAKATAAECVARAASAWTMPDPGSWMAKVSVDL